MLSKGSNQKRIPHEVSSFLRFLAIFKYFKTNLCNLYFIILMSLIGSPNEASYQSVVTSAEGAVIDVDAVGVAGLPMRTFCTK